MFPVVLEVASCISQPSNLGWAWIFILEGLITVVAGGISYFFIQDFPDTAAFLSEKERMSFSGRLRLTVDYDVQHDVNRGFHNPPSARRQQVKRCWRELSYEVRVEELKGLEDMDSQCVNIS